MPVRYEITHRTVYRYTEPVRFGEHRVLFRPGESHDQRVLATDLRVRPAATIRLIQDPQSNSVALVQPLQAAAELEIVCTFTIEHVYANELELPTAPWAVRFPFTYSDEEHIDLEHYLRPHHDDAGDTLGKWARQFVGSDDAVAARDVLARMNRHIRDTLRYEMREEEGTQTPLDTLTRGTGTCRDFALLMIEAMRRLGVAARFVSGYLYDPLLDRAGPRPAANGTTHAWLQAYLPGAGWVAFDPTNNPLGGTRLIRVGVARHPAQAAPVAGSWFGPADTYRGMTVEVRVERKDEPALRPAIAPMHRPAPARRSAVIG